MQNAAIYCARFLISLYTGLLPPLLPLFMKNLDLSLALTGSLVSVFSLFTSLLQPVFGWIADRIGYKVFIEWSPLWVGASIGMLGFCDSYGLLALCLSVAGLGISAFHPAVFGYIGSLPSRNNSHAISLLLLWGSLGFVAGPLAVSLFTDFAGIGKSWFLLLPGAAITLALLRSLAAKRETITGHSDYTVSGMVQTIQSIRALFMFATCITIITMNLFCFTPIVWSTQGYSVVVIGTLLSVFTLGCAAGPVMGARLAEIIGEKKVILLATVLSLILLPCFVHVQQVEVKGAVFFFLGVALMFPYSIIIDFGQQHAPQHRALVSSLLGGFAWGVGGLVILVTGPAAEILGVNRILDGLGVFLLINVVLIWFCSGFRR
ncbi:MAG: MFS transporter [Deltaproteobacteria bacterium]|nr:MFS transporter [Deltaproteobacteria bacterium]